MIITGKQVAQALTELVCVEGLEVDDIEELIDALEDENRSFYVID